MGRKRDHSRDAPILDAALAVLAEAGYEGMTIDMVAARAGAARATVYRRWAAKADLVLAAAARLSETDVGLDHLPDTGSFREDVIALFVPDTPGDQQVRLQALIGLLMLARTDKRLADAATKAGMIGLARTWALELAQFGITVNVVAPGPIAGTKMFHDVVPADSEREAKLAASIPVRRLGRPTDVARAVLFFAAAESGFITGQTLFVCGGSSVGSVAI